MPQAGAMTVSASPARCEPDPKLGSGQGWLWTRRLVQLYVGLACYGISAAMMVRARLGLDPWDVLHQGIAHRTGHAIGTVSVVVGVFVLLLWLPLPQRPGLGTVSNVLVVGLAMNQALRVLPAQHGFGAQLAMLVGAIALCGLATGMYISAGLGPGPRDGLMTGYARKTGLSIRLTRTVLELTVLGAGWLLGGSVGIGTVLFAVGIGPLSQLSLRLMAIPGVPISRSAVEEPVTRPRRRPGPARWRTARPGPRTRD
jgi:uncharacterized membrane protein YczE